MDPGTQLSKNIPELFRTQRQAALAASQAQTPSSPSVTLGSHTERAIPALDPGWEQLPSLFDLERFAMDIKSTVTAAITDIKTDIQAVAHRIDNVEQTTQTHAAAIRQVQRTYDTQLSQLFELHRHVEDLDNRGRRHNIRVRGVPESTDPGSLQQTIYAKCNYLIDRPADSPIDMERAHRALRPQSHENEPPGTLFAAWLIFHLRRKFYEKQEKKAELFTMERK